MGTFHVPGTPEAGGREPLISWNFVYRRGQAINKIVSGWTSAGGNIKLGNGLESNGEGEAMLEEVILN